MAHKPAIIVKIAVKLSPSNRLLKLSLVALNSIKIAANIVIIRENIFINTLLVLYKDKACTYH